MNALTKSGQPRKRKPGAGRPFTGRTAHLPRVRPEVVALVEAAAAARGVPLHTEVERRLLAGA